MKSAVKVLSILGIVFIGIALLVMVILTVNIKSLIQFSYEQGTLYFNGSPATSDQVEFLKNMISTIFIIVDVVLAASTVLPIINLSTADSDNKVTHLVLGILDILTGILIIVGILQILIYAGVEETHKDNTITIE